jgi:hypothetical protein
MTRRAFLPALVLLAFAAQSARAQVKLEYKFLEGTKSSHKTTSKVHQVLSIMGMDVETEAEESVVTSTSVGKRNADGTLPVAQKIESLKSQLSLPGGINVSFDSANPDAKIDNAQVAFLGDVYRAMLGVGYTVVLDDKNKVKFVEGTETFAAKVDALEGTAALVLKGRLSAEKIKKAFEQEHANLPDVLARKGEPWELTQTSDIGGGQTLTFGKRYEYLGTVDKDNKTLDKIGVRALTVKYEMDPNSPSPLKVTKSDLKIESSDGTFLFDREQGQIVDSKEVTRIKGNLTLSANGQDLPSTLDLTFDVAGRRERKEK